MRIKAKTVMDQMNAEKPDDVLADLEAKHGSSLTSGSARTCEWETIAPAKVCGQPAVCETSSGKSLCRKHGQHLENKWPGYIHLLKSPNDPN